MSERKSGDPVAVWFKGRALNGVVVNVGKVLTEVELDEPQPMTYSVSDEMIVTVFRHHHEVCDRGQ